MVNLIFIAANMKNAIITFYRTIFHNYSATKKGRWETSSNNRWYNVIIVYTINLNFLDKRRK